MSLRSLGYYSVRAALWLLDCGNRLWGVCSGVRSIIHRHLCPERLRLMSCRTGDDSRGSDTPEVTFSAELFSKRSQRTEERDWNLCPLVCLLVKWAKNTQHCITFYSQLYHQISPFSSTWPWTPKPVRRVHFFKIEIYASSESWINNISRDVWFVMIGQYL